MSSFSRRAGPTCPSPSASARAAGPPTSPSTPCRWTRPSCGWAASHPRSNAWSASWPPPGAGSRPTCGRGPRTPRRWVCRWGRRREPPRRRRRSGRPVPPDALRFVELVGLFLERFFRRRLRRQDAVEILDLLVLLIVLEVLFELHLLAHEGALRVGPQVGRLGRGREA